MKHYRKLIISIIVCITSVILMCGCSAASERQMISYSENNYGKARCISYTNDDKKSTAVMEDEQYGFKYTVTSSVNNLNIDGATPIDCESKSSDFFEKYTEYISKTEKFQEILEKYNGKIEIGSIDCAWIHIDNCKDAENTADMIAEVITDMDTRNYFIDNNIMLFFDDHQENSAGEYSFKDSLYRSPEEATINWMLESAAHSIHYLEGDYKKDIPDTNEFEYMYSEYMDSSVIPGRVDDNYPLRTPPQDTEESLAHTRVIHFMYNNQEWIVADCLDKSANLYVYCLSASEIVCTQPQMN